MRSSPLWVVVGVSMLSSCADPNTYNRGALILEYDPVLTPSVRAKNNDIIVYDVADELPITTSCANGVCQPIVATLGYARVSFTGFGPTKFDVLERRSDGNEVPLFTLHTPIPRSSGRGENALFVSRTPVDVAIKLPWVDESGAYVTNLVARASLDGTTEAKVTINGQRNLNLTVWVDGVRSTSNDTLALPTILLRNGAPQQVEVAVQKPAGVSSCAIAIPELTSTFSSTETADRVTARLETPLLTGLDEPDRSPARMISIRVTCDFPVEDGGFDAGFPDAGGIDSGVSDAGVPDAGNTDAGAPDAGEPDAGVPDAGAPDAGVVDAGVPAQLACAPAVYAAALTGSDRINRHAANGTLTNTFSPFGSNGAVRVAPLKRTNGTALAVLSVDSGVVTIFDQSGSVEQSFTPLSGNGGSIAGCDIDFDGNDDVVVGNREGTTAQFVVRHFTGVSQQPVNTVSGNTRATSVACGQVDSQSTIPRVVVGPGYGTSNQVRVYTAQGGLISSFTPYTSAFWDGVEVSVAKTNENQNDRIITAQRTFSATEVRAFTGGGTQVGNRSVFGSAYEEGSSVSAADLNGDGVDEVIVGQRMNAANVRVLSGDTLVETGSWTSSGFTGGIALSAAPRASWQCPTTQPDAGMPDAGTPVRDAGAGCTADEGRLLGVLPPGYPSLYTRVEQRHGIAWFTEGGTGGYASLWNVKLDGGALTPVAQAMEEPTGLVVTDSDVYFSDKGHIGQLNGLVVNVPLDGGQPYPLAMMQDFTIGVARVTIDAGTSSEELVWINAGNTRLNRSDLWGANQVSTSTLGGPVVMTTDATHVYYATSNRAVQRFPLDFVSTSVGTTIVSSQTFPLDPVYALQVVGDDLFILHSAGLPNARTRVVKFPRDGTGAPTPVVTVNGVFSTSMHIVGNWLYVGENGYAPGCSTYRVWRVPVTASQTFTVEPVANSSSPISDFSVGPQWLVLLRNGVWAVPAPSP
ncbi:MAG: hypothetical protein ACO1OB_02415 [Archangium sp.]